MDNPSRYNMTARKLFWSGPTTFAIVGVAAPVYTLAWAAGRIATILLPGQQQQRKTLFDSYDDWLYSHYQNFCSLFFVHAAGTHYTIYGDRPLPDENVVYISNHQCTLDWFVCNVLANEVNCVGRIRYILKDGLRMLPFYGWYFKRHGCVYISKAWREDQERLKQGLKKFARRERPYWLVIFPEGTRFDVGNAQVITRSQAFARSRGLPVFSQVLSPRTRGFTETLACLGTSCDAIYNVTVAYTKQLPHQMSTRSRPRAPSMWDLMTGRYPQVHIHLERIPLNQLPTVPDGNSSSSSISGSSSSGSSSSSSGSSSSISSSSSEEHAEKVAAVRAQWLHERFAAKERMLQALFERGEPFPGKGYSPRYNARSILAHGLAYTGILAPFLLTSTGRKTLAALWLGPGLGGVAILALMGPPQLATPLPPPSHSPPHMSSSSSVEQVKMQPE